MTILHLVNILLAAGVILGQLFIAVSAAYLLFFRKQQNPVAAFLARRGMALAFLVALVSVSGSLFYSQVAQFPPCDLCWFQRIFMYPLVFLLGMALAKKDFHIISYALALSIIGGVISLYHNYIYYDSRGLNAHCLIAGQGISCVKRYVFEFGYVTIPMMALTAFLLIIIFLLFKKLAGKNP